MENAIEVPPYRILVTGSRFWPQKHADFVHERIGAAIASVRDRSGPRDVVLVHGANMSEVFEPYSGLNNSGPRVRRAVCVDRLADEHLMLSPYGPNGSGLLTVERHPAEWARHPGKTGGIRRNEKMVALGADLCLAFPMRDSKGTMHCLTAAIRAGITTRVYPLGSLT